MSFDRLEAIIKARTPGPWAWKDSSQLKRICDEDALAEYYATNAVLSTFGSQPIWAKQPDRDFIATMGTLADLLLDVVKAAEKVDVYPAHFKDTDIGRAVEALRAAQDKLP